MAKLKENTMILGAMRIPETPREVEGFDPASCRTRKGIDRGWLILLLEGECPKAVEQRISLPDRGLHLALVRDIDFTE